MKRTMDETSLNEKYGIENHVEFVSGEGGLTKARLQLKSGTSAEIYLQGATVVSFKNEKGKELIYVSPKAIFSTDKAIRGGIPICFPQFGAGKLPQHGFVRNNPWIVVGTNNPSPNEVSITLRFEDNEKHQGIWNNSFTAEIETKITFDSEKSKSIFRQNFSVTNNNDKDPFDFTAALHTYFAINDIHKISVSPLNDLSYFNKVKNSDEKQIDKALNITGETDRIYYNAPDTVVISEDGNEIFVEKKNFSDFVVWNIWVDKCKDIADLHPDSWKKYICVEATQVGKPITLAPNKTWTASQQFYSS